MIYQLANLPGYRIDDVIHQSKCSLVYKGIRLRDQLAVVIKVLCSPHPSLGELVRFRNQYQISCQLDHPNILRPLALERAGNRYGLVMPDQQMVSLAEYQPSQRSLADILKIIIQLADTLHYLAVQRIIHKDIKPSNVLIHPATGQVQLIDFSLASLLPKEHQQLANPNLLEGSLAYLSPEQTGRMNRGIDYRTDFYSLGVMLFELLTGQLPFATTDPITLVHCHMAQPVIFPEEGTAIIPAMVRQIVIKLMAKNAEDRYQNALGLKHDLEHCAEQWRTTGSIAPFQLGQRDVSDRFLIPEKLYGRQTEVAILLEAFDRVSKGASELMLVAGFSGVGKTVVVNEVHKPITRQQGFFIKGKFDQFSRNIPFSAFGEAFRSLMRHLLGEPDAVLAQWRVTILNALGENGQIIIDLIPELAQIIDNQPAVPNLSGAAAQNRFNLLFRKFIQVFATVAHPLVIFLDDLQWADAASLQLLKLLMEDSELGYLLVLGAYRDNEVFPAHPLMLALTDIQKQSVNLHTLELLPLGAADITRLVANTLMCAPNIARPLAQLVYQRTQGNPFFTTQFLYGLHNDGWITFNHDAGHWQCDLIQVHQLALTDDVVEFMMGWLCKLPETTQHVLKIAACMGNRFDLETLAEVCEANEEDIATDLWQSLLEGLVVPETQTYKFFQDTHDGVNLIEHITVGYRLLHDRVQQAARRLIPEEQIPATHLHIGRRLLATTPASERESRIFDIVNHLNQGRTLLAKPAEKLELAELNLQAGQQAREDIAYQAAFDYLSIGLKLLPTQSWQNHYPLTLALYQEGAIAAYLIGNFEMMAQWVAIALENTNTLLERVPFYETQIQACVAQKRLPEAIQLGIEILDQLGEAFPQQPTPEDFKQGIAQVTASLAERPIATLIQLPAMVDPRAIAILKILWRLSSVLFMAAPQLMPFCMFRAVQLSIESGNSILSAPAYATYGMILCSRLGDIPTGYQFGQLALHIIEKYQGKEIQAKTLARFASGICHWQNPLQETLPLLSQGYQLGLEVGDLESAAICATAYGYHSYFAGKELIQLEQELRTYSQSMRSIGQQTILQWNNVYHQQTLNLLGESEDPTRLQGTAYDETAQLPLKQHYQDGVGLGMAYLFKTMACYLFDDLDQARANLTLTAQYIQRLAPFVFNPAFHFYQALIDLSTLDTGLEPGREHLDPEHLDLEHLDPEHLDPEHLDLEHLDPERLTSDIPESVEKSYQKLQRWAKSAPMNYQHKVDLIAAERWRAMGELYKAGDFYDRAITGAKANDYIQEEALAHELAAKFYLSWGKKKVAAGYMQNAYYCYANWGAKAKTNALATHYPQLLQPILQQRHQTISLFKVPTLQTMGQATKEEPKIPGIDFNIALDFAALLQASQAISNIIELEPLLQKLTEILLQNSGGDRCALILLDDHGDSQVSALATPQTITILRQPLEVIAELPIHLIQYVKRSQTTVVQHQATDELPIIEPYLSQHQFQSVLCTPLLVQGQGIGILYISNQMTQDVFRGDRLQVLTILANQAAISLKNAQLYALEQARSEQLTQLNVALQYSEAQANAAFDQASIGFIETNQYSKYFTRVNHRFCVLLGYTQAELLKMKVSDITHPEDIDASLASIEKLYAGEIDDFTFEKRYIRKDGTVLWGETTVYLVKLPDGEVVTTVGLVQDISDRKQAQSQLIHNALHDALTDLPNRSLLMQQLELTINRARRSPDYNFAILFLDLDNFKVINDSLGHQAGDNLLISISQRLQSILRSTDLVTRLGGDEFVLLLDNFGGHHEVIQTIERIFNALKMPLLIEEREVFITASIGVVVGTQHYDRAADLLRDADIAMYRAKAQGKGRYAIFDAHMHTQILHRMQLEYDLRRAIEQDELVVYYQPIISLEKHKILGLEALVRWQHPTRGSILPTEFISIAEETELITLLDHWVLRVACKQLAGWHHQFSEHENLKININLSGRDLQETTNLIVMIEQALSQNHLTGKSLTLEITESVLIENKAQTIDLLQQLKSLGINICIDDFGTGYSSLSYLCDLPVTTVKVDKSFVSQMQASSKNYKVVEAVIALSHQLNLGTVAEGIETPQQLDWVKTMGSEYGQGYLFAKPLDAETMTRLLSRDATFDSLNIEDR